MSFPCQSLSLNSETRSRRVWPLPTTPTASSGPPCGRASNELSATTPSPQDWQFPKAQHCLGHVMYGNSVSRKYGGFQFV